MEIIGYIAAVLMGLTLGTIGGGGSILTVPILVYLMGVSPTLATGYSLLIVGATAAFGAMRYYKQGMVDIRAAIVFAVPSIIAVYIARAAVMPALPDTFTTSGVAVSRDAAIMVLFASLMVTSAIMMLRNSRSLAPPKTTKHPTVLIAAEGAIVGLVTGVLGAGGGFLIIPALVLLVGMPMKQAVGASLFIIASKSLIGFIGDIQNGIPLLDPMLAFMMMATIVGMWLATHVSKRFDGKKLQGVFAIFTLIVAAIIFVQELFV